MSLFNVVKKAASNIFIKSYFVRHKHHGMKVTVCGAAGRVGGPLCLLLKQSPLISELAVHDSKPINGFGMELGLVDTRCKVSAYSGADGLSDALKDAKIVVMVAAASNTAHLAYSGMFEANANIAHDIAQGIAVSAPNAITAIATCPVNSIVPLASEVLKKNAAYDMNKVFGITALDAIRTNTFAAEVQGLRPEQVAVPVIGGNSDKTIVPLLSHAKPCAKLSPDEIEFITDKVQSAHYDVIKAKQKKSANLSMAYAITKFVISLIHGLNGYNNIIEYAYVRSKAHADCKYLATPLLLGEKGIVKNLGLPVLSDYEACLLEGAIPLITKSIKQGEMFAGVTDPAPCDPCDPKLDAPPCPKNFCD